MVVRCPNIYNALKTKALRKTCYTYQIEERYYANIRIALLRNNTALVSSLIRSAENKHDDFEINQAYNILFKPFDEQWLLKLSDSLIHSLFLGVLNELQEDFILNTDGFKAEHGFVSIVANDHEGFFITWLDGRNTVEKEEDGGHKPMTIRFAEITNAGDLINEIELDSSVCDCCQTSITNTDKGPLVVYRDRSDKEVRDIYVIRNIDNVWETPVPVHNDEWVIYGCPVNGPKVVSNSNNLAVSWFTVSDGKPTVNISFSEFYGSSFGNPIKINDYDAIGRVDVAFLNEEEVLVSYMEGDDDGTYLRIKKVSIEGKVSEPITISKIDSGRNTGVPQLEILDNEIFIVWTVFENENNQLKTVKLSFKDI